MTYAILIMNACAWALDRALPPRRFGVMKGGVGKLKKLMIPVAVILICALVLFGASSVLAGTSEAKAQEEFDQILSYVLPGGGEYEEEEYTGSDSSIKAVYRNDNGVALRMTALRLCR